MATLITEDTAPKLVNDGWKSRSVILGGIMIILTILGVAVVITTGVTDNFLLMAPWLGSRLKAFLGIALASTAVTKMAKAVIMRAASPEAKDADMPIPHAGWLSRSMIIGCSMISLAILGTILVLATGKVAEFMRLAPWLGSQLDAFLGIMLGSTTLGNVAEAVRRR